MRRSSLPALLSVLLAALLAAPLVAQPLGVGAKTPVFATSEGGINPIVALGADGGFAVVWERDHILLVRAFTASGAPAGPEHELFRAITTGDRRLYPGARDVAALAEGGYIAVWDEIVPIDSSARGAIRFQRLDAAGRPLRSPETLQEGPSGFSSSFSLLPSPSGGLTLLWEFGGFALFVQRFSAAGVPQSSFSDLTEGYSPDKTHGGAALPDGGFAVATLFKPEHRLLVQRLHPDGSPTAPAVPVNAERAAQLSGLAVAAGPAGHFVVTWQETALPPQTERRALARVFGSDGTPLSPEIVFATLPAGTLHAVLNLSVRADGSFLVQHTAGPELLAGAFTVDGQRIAPDAVIDGGNIEFFQADAVPTTSGWVTVWTSFTPTGISGPWFRFVSLPCASATGSGLCLNDNRFRAEVTWRVPSTGASGVGHPIALTGDTGDFWFFDPANRELNVKVLDGRAVNGHFWVFYSSLTDVAFELTVTDTETGQQRIYRNPAGTMASRADTAAF